MCANLEIIFNLFCSGAQRERRGLENAVDGGKGGGGGVGNVCEGSGFLCRQSIGQVGLPCVLPSSLGPV